MKTKLARQATGDTWKTKSYVYVTIVEVIILHQNADFTMRNVIAAKRLDILTKLVGPNLCPVHGPKSTHYLQDYELSSNNRRYLS